MILLASFQKKLYSWLWFILKKKQAESHMGTESDTDFQASPLQMEQSRMHSVPPAVSCNDICEVFTRNASTREIC